MLNCCVVTTDWQRTFRAFDFPSKQQNDDDRVSDVIIAPDISIINDSIHPSSITISGCQLPFTEDELNEFIRLNPPPPVFLLPPPPPFIMSDGGSSFSWQLVRTVHTYTLNTFSYHVFSYLQSNVESDIILHTLCKQSDVQSSISAGRLTDCPCAMITNKLFCKIVDYNREYRLLCKQKWVSFWHYLLLFYDLLPTCNIGTIIIIVYNTATCGTKHVSLQVT